MVSSIQSGLREHVRHSIDIRVPIIEPKNYCEYWNNTYRGMSTYSKAVGAIDQSDVVSYPFHLGKLASLPIPFNEFHEVKENSVLGTVGTDCVGGIAYMFHCDCALEGTCSPTGGIEKDDHCVGGNGTAFCW
jgi:hypothetical protein